MAGELNFDDFLASYRMMRKMGSVKSLISMIPGMGKQLEDVDVDERELPRTEAIILSMTPRERKTAARDRRLASPAGSRRAAGRPCSR